MTEYADMSREELIRQLTGANKNLDIAVKRVTDLEALEDGWHQTVRELSEILNGHHERADKAEARVKELEKALGEVTAENARRAGTIRNYDDVINALPDGKVRVLLANAIVEAHNGAGREELRDRLIPIKVVGPSTGGPPIFGPPEGR